MDQNNRIFENDDLQEFIKTFIINELTNEPTSGPTSGPTSEPTSEPTRGSGTCASEINNFLMLSCKNKSRIILNYLIDNAIGFNFITDLGGASILFYLFNFRYYS